MTDERLRRLRRDAAKGDAEAAARLAYERWRLGDAPPSVPGWERVVRRAGAAAWTPAALSDARLRALEEDLAPLGALAPRAVAFVRAGEDEGLLAAVAALEARTRDALRLKRPGGRRLGEQVPRPVFLAGELAPAPFLLRLGVLYDAALPATRDRKLPRALGWLEALLWECAHEHPTTSGGRRAPPRLGVAEIEAALTLARARPWWPVAVAVLEGWPTLSTIVRAMGGFAAALERFPRPVRRALSRTAHDRACALDVIERGGVDPGPWTDAIVRAATADDLAFVRHRATPVVRALGERAVEPLRAVLRDGGAASRLHAATFLWDIAGDGAREVLAEVAKSDRSEKVRRGVAALLAGPPRLGLRSPARAQPAAIAVPGPTARAAFDQAFGTATAELRDRCWALVAQPAPWTSLPEASLAGHHPRVRVRGPLLELGRQPDLDLAHLVRIAWLTGGLTGWDQGAARSGACGRALGYLETHRTALGRPLELHLVVRALEAAALDADLLGLLALSRATLDRPFSATRWTGVHAYYTGRPHLVAQALRSLSGLMGTHRTTLLDELAAVLAALDPLPEPVVDALLEVALGTAKRDRAMARSRLARAPGIAERVAAELESTRPSVRKQAAEWLAELG